MTQHPGKGTRGARQPSATEDEELHFDVVVVGAGPSGLAAGIAAVRGGARTCVLERDVRAGLTILATGNGRCNLSNAHLDPARYRHPEAFREVAGGAPEEELRGFFESLGLMVAEEGGGRLYPRTRRAESVRDVLLRACSREGVEVRCCCTLEAARHDGAAAAWELDVSEPAEPLRPKRGRDGRATLRNERRALQGAEMAGRRIRARSVVIACGGACEGMAGIFGLPHLLEEPVLRPIAATSEVLDLERLDGLRVEAALTLMHAGEAIAREEGEVLFRPHGVSGIAAFNLSRHAREGDRIELDLFPELDLAELAGTLHARERRIGALARSDASWFDGVLAPELGRQVCAALPASTDRAASAAALCKHLPLDVAPADGSEEGQVRRGGIPLDALELETLAARPGHGPALHACGAALDMDADCGGYNLSWAWLSGLRAGAAAAHDIYGQEGSC